jgi:hypothetical protein
MAPWKHRQLRPCMRYRQYDRSMGGAKRKRRVRVIRFGRKLQYGSCHFGVAF